jgi:hypothetical protein
MERKGQMSWMLRIIIGIVLTAATLMIVIVLLGMITTPDEATNSGDLPPFLAIVPIIFRNIRFRKQ